MVLSQAASLNPVVAIRPASRVSALRLPLNPARTAAAIVHPESHLVTHLTAVVVAEMPVGATVPPEATPIAARAAVVIVNPSFAFEQQAGRPLGLLSCFIFILLLIFNVNLQQGLNY